MGKLGNYFKRGIKYIIKDYKQPIVYANMSEQSKNECHKNKIYLVTGGGSGLGFYIAKSLIKSGAQVIITGRNENNLKKASRELGNKCSYKIMDVTNIQESKKVLEDIFESFHSIDGLVNNAGVSLHEKNILSVNEENYDIQFNTNLKGAYFLSKYYIELFKKNKMNNGNILFISSERGSMCDDIPYGLTKVAINSLTQGLSRRFLKDGLRVNAVAPGVTCSGLNNIDKNGDLFANKASGRILVPEEIAEICNYILSDYSKCISGEIINCDGGNHISSYF